MKALMKHLKPMAGLLALCLLLTLAQTACELVLPGLLSQVITRGVQQGGLEAGAPEAVSLQGMTLLQTFLSPEDRELLGSAYFTIRPGSTEAERLSREYPLVRERTICLRREDLTEEAAARIDRIYATAADAVSRYLAQAEETGELEETARYFAEEQKKEPGEFRSNVRDLAKEESSLPEGVIGRIPDDALFTMPEPSSVPQEEGSEPSEEPSEEPAPEGGESFSGTAMMGTEAQTFGTGGDVPKEPEEPETGSVLPVTLDSRGVAGMDAEQLYTLLPLLAQSSGEGVRQAVAAAEAAAVSEPDRGLRLGIPLKALFYRELGAEVDGLRAGTIGLGALRLVGLEILEILLALAAGLLTARAAARLGSGLRRELVAQGRAATGDVRPTQRLIARGIRGLCYGPVLILGGSLLAARASVSAEGTAAWLLALGLAALLILGSVLKLAPLRGVIVRGATLRRRLGPWESLPAALLVPAGLLGMNGICGIFALADDRGIRNAVLPVGSRMAALEYAGMIVLGGALTAWALWELPGERAAARRVMGEKKEDRA